MNQQMRKDVCGAAAPIAIFVEASSCGISRVVLELISKATEIASKSPREIVAFFPCFRNADLASELAEAGADRVIVAKDPLFDTYETGCYASAVSAMARSTLPDILLFGATPLGRDLAPRVANRLVTGLTADCTALDFDTEEGLLLQTRPAFGGNVMATIVCPKHRPQMATVRPGAMPLSAAKKYKRVGKIEFFDAKISPVNVMSRILDITRKDVVEAGLESAKIVVSGGRGMKGVEGFEILKGLASLIGARLGASRAAVDSGWISHEHQVGQTGHSTHPDIYVACGISGAIQHISGMGGSKFIIAINKDRNAPIHDVADLSIVGDIFKVIPKLIEMIKEQPKS
ncbi:MAG TPA: electron transfer flavoprotein subunit alpha/FixB family protein [bacterium]|nr:electron transfer flavoprotein subunit alpha/FixB family protein [bacterium]